jgi:GDP/UDP-N,N'-diacetylbacillosamine 2-epimerase (hydrolysing)
MQGIREHPDLELQVVATGMHLSPEFGLTYQEILDDGFTIDRKVEMLLSSDTAIGLSKSMGLGMIGFGDTLADLSPDVVVVLGDRFEILAAATAAMVARIPIAHLHGGEATEGMIDEAIRHAVTKMSHLHFVAAEEYRRRVIQLGEQPHRVYLVGGLGVDAIRHQVLLARDSLEDALGFRLLPRNLLITFHPVSLERATAAHQMAELLAALGPLRDTGLIFTMPNADTDGRGLFEQINHFVADHPNACVFTSLGQRRYLSTLQFVDGVVGNSSSGLAEVPSFRKGTVNIGDRQRGRIKAESVIDCAPERHAIAAALNALFAASFQAGLPGVRNPYGDGGASERIVEVLATVSLEHILKKRFYDMATV